MSTPDVSIVIPVFNRPALVGEAVTSALSQGSRVNLEVVVVDDHSTDDTWVVVSSLGSSIRSIRQPKNGGQSVARNTGLDLALGKYVKFLDSDDFLNPGHLADEVRYAESERADIVVSGWRDTFPDGTARDWVAPRFQSIVDDVLAGLAVPTSAALYLKEKCPRWDPRLRKLDDWDFFCQTALGVSRIVSVAGVAYSMRNHSGDRATDVSMFANAREHHAVLQKIESRLVADGRLTNARRKRLAQYYYKEMRVFSLFDREQFERAMEHILALDQQFQPVDEERQRWMRLAARVLGPRRAILLHSKLKKLFRSAAH